MGAYVTLPNGQQKYVPANPYCTLEEVLIELRRKSDDAPEGSVLCNEIMVAIEHASRYIDRWMGRDWFQHDHRTSPLEFDQFSPKVTVRGVFLPWSPLISGLALEVNGSTLTQNVDYCLDQEQYEDMTWRCKVQFLNVQFSGPQTVALGTSGGVFGLDRASGNVLRVYGLFGYAQASNADVPTGLPEIVELATHQIAAAMSGHLRKEIVGIEGRREEIVSKDFSNIAKEILGPKHGTVLC